VEALSFSTAKLLPNLQIVILGPNRGRFGYFCLFWVFSVIHQRRDMEQSKINIDEMRALGEPSLS
jgi:hypothetical protein